MHILLQPEFLLSITRDVCILDVTEVPSALTETYVMNRVPVAEGREEARERLNPCVGSQMVDSLGSHRTGLQVLSTCSVALTPPPGPPHSARG